MKIEQMFEEIEDDLSINNLNLKDKLYLIPKLHSKYLRLYFDVKNKAIKKKKILDSLYREKFYHYKDNDIILDKKEIQWHIISDPEYSKVKYEYDTLLNIEDVLDRTVKKVNNLSFDVKNLITFLDFTSGG